MLTSRKVEKIERELAELREYARQLSAAVREAVETTELTTEKVKELTATIKSITAQLRDR